MILKVFGELRDIVNENDLNAITISNVARLKQELQKQYPQLREKVFRVAVNRQLADDDTAINTTDEIALLPPFSGG